MESKERKYLNYIRKELFPKLKVVKKSDSFFMRFLAKLMLFCPKFMTHYVTTIGNTIYIPKDEIPSIPALAHELQHMSDSKKWGPLYYLGYLFPQILALGVVLTSFHPAFLLCLLFLAPLPSFSRTLIERRGYLMSIITSNWLGKEQNIDRVVKQFTGPNYYYMSPNGEKRFRKKLERYFDQRWIPPNSIRAKTFSFLYDENLLK